MTAGNPSEAQADGQGEAPVLPIITRAWCVRDQPTLRGPQRQPGPRPTKFIVISVVETAAVSMPGTPAATLGVAWIGYIHGSDWDVTREIWFYNPLTARPETIAACQAFIAANTMSRGAEPNAARVWRDDPAVTVKLIAIDEFLRTFFAIATDKKRALIVGYDLLATFGALAAFWGRARPRHPKSRKERLLHRRLERLKEKGETADVARGRVQITCRLRWMMKARKRRLQRRPARPGRWSLALVAEPDPTTGERKPARYLPRILMEQVGAAGMVASWGSVPRKCRPPTGEFLDLANLCHGLTHEHFQFAEAVAEFVPGRAGRIEGSGSSPAGIRATGKALVILAERLVSYFDLLHPGLTRANGGPLAETKVYGAGGIARAYARGAGYQAPAVAPEWVGFCAEANHGAWCGIGVRGRLPVVPTDFRREYTTVFARQGIGALLAATRLDFVEATDEIRKLAATGPVALGPHLNAVCLINLRGEPAMVRALFKDIKWHAPDAENFTLAMALRYADEVPTYLADVIKARVLYGRAPEIVKGWKIVAAAPRALRHVNLMGRHIDPAEIPIPLALAEEGERFKRRLGRFGKGPLSAIPDEVRKLLVNGIKAAGNIFAYGMLLQTNQIDLPRGTHGEAGSEEATLLHAKGAMRRRVKAPEEDAEFICVPLAGLVAASGRLLLARLHRAVADRGGVMACHDTDSGHIVATPKGSIVEIEQRGADGKGLPAAHVKALSWREVDDIVALFEAENPFDKSLFPGSPLRLTDENFDEETDKRIALEGLYISPKRYCLIAPDGTLSDTKASLIGVPLPPVNDFVNDIAWRWLIEAFAGKAPKPPSWFATPLVREMRVSTPDLAFKLRGRKPNGHKVSPPALETVYPGIPYLATVARRTKPAKKDGRLTLEVVESCTVVAPFSDDPAAWETLPWRFLSGEPMPLTGEWQIETWGRFMSAYLLASAPAMLGPDGKPAGAYTRGVLRLRSMRDGQHFYVLKEGAEYGDDPEHAFDLVGSEMFSCQSPPPVIGDTASDRAKREHEADASLDAVRAAIGVVGAEAVAEKLGVARRTVQAWMADKNRPADIAKIEGAILGAALTDLGLAADCKALPKALLFAQRFNTMVAVTLARHFGGRPGLAGMLGMSRRALDLAIVDRSTTGKSMGTFLARLGKRCRAELVTWLAEATGREAPTIEEGRRGDRVAITALVSLIVGARTPITKPAEWCLALPEIVTGGDLERLDELDARPSGWLAFASEMARVLGVADRKAKSKAASRAA